MFKAICGLTPTYKTDNILMVGETHDRDTRLSKSYDANAMYTTPQFRCAETVIYV